MKRFFILFLTVTIPVLLFAQAPNLFNYQGVARDLSGNPLPNKNAGLRISILQGSVSGTEVYKELFLVTTNSLGLFNIQIGSGTVAKGNLASVDWGTGPYFLKIELDPTATNIFQEIGTSQLVSVPYAMFAKNSGNGFSGNYNDLTNKPSGVNRGDMQYWSGTRWELIPAGSNGMVLKFVNGIPAWVIGLPLIKTLPVTNITSSEATSGATSISDGGEELAGRGICWSTTPYPTVSNFKTSNGTGTETFTVTITGLTSSSTYYVRAYATNSQGTAYGNQVSFNTAQNLSQPVVSTASPTSVTITSALLGGNVTSEGSAAVTDRGIVYSTSENPTTANNKTQIGNGAGTFSTTITGLATNTTYYTRAYAISSQGTVYGNQVSFTTLQNLTLAIVTTATPTLISSGSATLGGNVLNEGNTPVTDCGIVYSATATPTISNSKVPIGSGNGPFSMVVTGLTVSTTYFVRSYAINSQGTSYGNLVTFTTLQTPILATVTTATPTAVTSGSATLGGNVTNDGNTPVIDCGIVYSTTSTPTVANNKVPIGSGSGPFSIVVSGFIANTTYYVRSYAINSQGTAYGPPLTFTTLLGPALASVTTATPTTITSGSATLGGNVASDGGAAVIDYGIVYATTESPTIVNSKVPIGTGTGPFNMVVSGMTASTTYYVRAYAINSQGTAYGQQTTFTTLPVASLPSVSTATPTTITAGSAILGGTVTSDGYATVSDRGIVFATTPTPTTSSNKTPVGSGTGVFSATVSGLVSNTTYYVRAYATNSQGTSYGEQVSFTTIQSLLPATVSTLTPTNITSGSAILGGSVTNDGYAAVYSRGIVYSSTQTPTISDTRVTMGTGTGTFSSTVAGLTPNTTFYVRAYATNSQGTAYGSLYSFKTPLVSSMANVNTSDPLSITAVSALLGGNVTFDGNVTITERGIVYSTGHNPILPTGKIPMGSGSGTYSATVTDLTPNTAYNAWAYATNSEGTAFGNEVSFTTLTASLATVTTATPTTITSSTAVLGGNVINDGNVAVTERGICYSTTENPTTSNNKTVIGSGRGSFSTTVTALTANTTYYVRAYAINSQGTAYGPQVSFTSLQ